MTIFLFSTQTFASGSYSSAMVFVVLLIVAKFLMNLLKVSIINHLVIIH